jgi:hypothetical protein
MSERVIAAMERSLISEANRFFAKMEADLTIMEERFAHGYTRFRRHLMSLKEDMAAYDEHIGRAGS